MELGSRCLVWNESIIIIGIFYLHLSQSMINIFEISSGWVDVCNVLVILRKGNSQCVKLNFPKWHI